jgi:hypothetical protein
MLRAWFVGLAVVCLCVWMNPAAAQTFETMIANGPSSNRVDMAFVGDGYTQSQIDNGFYENQIGGFLDYMFSDSALTDPFYRYRNYFNVHRIDVVSNESGADKGPEGIYRDTALDARYYTGGVERALTVNVIKAETALYYATLGSNISVEMRLAPVNDNKYGGTGGGYAVYAAGNSSAYETALHEIGHQFADLGDEYSGSGTYAGGEPSRVNLTTDPAGAKWDQWLGYNQPGIGVIGAYEGADEYNRGLYRPSQNSKMRSLGRPFDVVSREQIILRIYESVDPLDDWTSNLDILINPTSIDVTPIDEATIDLEWYLDGLRLDLPDITTLDIASLNLGQGDYELTARAFDPTGFDPVDGWVRRDQDLLEQFIHWNVKIIAVPEAGSLLLAGLGLSFIAARRLRRVP